LLPGITFLYLCLKITAMETIVIQVKGKSKAKQILDAVKLLNGVTNATIASEEELENLSILRASKAARKTEKVTKADVLNALK
jgi:hypothetical protein